MATNPEKFEGLPLHAIFFEFDLIVSQLALLELKSQSRNALKEASSHKNRIMPEYSPEQTIDILGWYGAKKTQEMIRFRRRLITRILRVIEEQSAILVRANQSPRLIEQHIRLIIETIDNYLKDNTFFDNSGLNDIKRNFGSFFGKQDPQIFTSIQEVLKFESEQYVNDRKQRIDEAAAKEEVENVLELVFKWELISSELRKRQ